MTDFESAQRACFVLLRVLHDIADAPRRSGVAPPLPEEIESLAMKVFAHAASAYWLSMNTQVSGLLENDEVAFLDIASLAVLARAALETYCAFHYVFRDPRDEDVKMFRTSAWRLAGLRTRTRFSEVNERNKESSTRALDVMELLRQAIKGTGAYAQLSDGKQKDVLAGRDWHPGKSIVDLAVAVGFTRELAQVVYALQSSYAHTDSVPGTHLRQSAGNRADQEMLATADLHLINATLGKFIQTYAEMFPPAGEFLASNPPARSIVDSAAGMASRN